MKFFIRLCGVAILALAVLLPNAVAQAVSTSWRLGAGIGSAALWVGQQVNRDGLLVYCTDFERGAPDAQAGYTDGHQGSFTRSDGSTLSARESAALSYLLMRWGPSKDNATAAAVQLSVWSLTSPGHDWGTPGMSQILTKAALPASVETLGRSLTEQSLRYGGPYRITAKLVRPGAAEVQLLSASGAQTPGLNVQLSASGSLRLSGGPSSWQSTAQSQLVPVQRTGLGAGTLSIKAASAPAAGLRWLMPVTAGKQRLISSGLSSTVTGQLVVPAATPFQPTVQTITSTKVLDGPGKLHDTLTVSTAAGQQWLQDPATGKAVQATVISTLWGPFGTLPAEADKAPEGAPSVGSVSTPISSPGKYETAELPIKTAGYYVWTERIEASSAKPASARDYLKPWSGRFGLAQETSLLPWAPELSTELSNHQATVGATISDLVTVRNAPPTEQATRLRLDLYGPLAPQVQLSKDVPAGSPLLKSITLPLADGQIADFGVLQAAGCYTVVATALESPTVKTFRSNFGEPSETVCLTAKKPHPPTPTHPPSTPPTPTTPPVIDKTPPPVAPAVATPSQPPAKQLAVTGSGGEGALAIGAALLITTGLGLFVATKHRKIARHRN